MILFDEAKHRYYDTQGDLISATTLLDRYSHKFDATVQSQITAAKHGETPEYWEEKWKKWGEERADYGTEFHEGKELQDGFVTRFNGKYVQTNNQWILLQRLNQWNYLRDLPDGHYTELRLWHSGYRVSGTSDRCLLETVNGKRFMHIEDHKTNLKLPKESFRDRKTLQYKMMKPPVSHIMDCKFWKYHLQLSLYQFMAEHMGFLPGERRILHYEVSDFEILNDQIPSVQELLKREPKVYDVRYMKKEVFSICEDYLRTSKRRP